jgi:hypothetical protein
MTRLMIVQEAVTVITALEQRLRGRLYLTGLDSVCFSMHWLVYWSSSAESIHGLMIKLFVIDLVAAIDYLN